MNVLFIGNFQTGPGGEIADEVHLARELAVLDHQVTCIPRDIWREYVREGCPIGKWKEVPESINYDIILIAKWHHFYDSSFIQTARNKYKAPVFYWVWDQMEGHTLGDWHMNMAQAADLYLSGELGLADWYRKNSVKFYYFQFDSTDGENARMSIADKKYDVVYLGSHTNQNGRLDILKEINKEIPIQVFAYDYEEWRKDGFKAEPAVYGMAFNRVVAESKIVLGTSAHYRIFGYWSNRVGKVLHAGGFLLQWYTPGMELFLADCCDYFSTSREAIEKITYYLKNPDKREVYLERNGLLNRDRWTSAYKMRQLSVLMDRYIKDPNRSQWMLP